MDERQFRNCYRYKPYHRQIDRCTNRKTKHFETRQDIRQDIWARISGCSDTSTGLVSQAIIRETNASYLRAWRAWQKDQGLADLANQFASLLITPEDVEDEQES